MTIGATHTTGFFRFVDDMAFTFGVKDDVPFVKVRRTKSKQTNNNNNKKKPQQAS